MRGAIEILVAYDVNTETPAGRRRLRRVSNVCVGFGQRVQKSLFECRVTAAQLEELEHRLRTEIDDQEDSLRIYRLAGERDKVLKVIGAPPPNDFREPMIV